MQQAEMARLACGPPRRPYSDRRWKISAPETPARRRLAYDELLASQLALALVGAPQHRPPGRRSVLPDGAAPVTAALPYQPDRRPVPGHREIDADMAAPHRMLRLLQGDVGSGKTVVALLAMLNAVEAGAQAAIMAPTEFLARQHLATLESPAAAAGVRVALLTGREKGRAGRRCSRARRRGIDSCRRDPCPHPGGGGVQGPRACRR